MKVHSDDPARFAPGSRVFVAPGLRPLVVRSVRTTRQRIVVAFEEVNDRTGAEALRGAELVVPAAGARALGENEYWDHDLIGCEVVTTSGEVVGRVTDVLHAPANEVLEVRSPGRESLIPLVADVVVEVVPGERITIAPLPGLLEG